MQPASTDMRFSMILGMTALTLFARTALAQEPPEPQPVAPTPPAVEEVPPAPPPVVAQPQPQPQPVAPAIAIEAPPSAEQPKQLATGPRDHGLRLALDMGYTRAAASDGSRLLTSGSPSLLPIGADVSWRIGAKTLAGLHGWVALASRDNCAGTDCTARSYGIGGQIEAGLVHAERFDLWLRYGAGFELLYQGGIAGDGGAHIFRDAIDIADLRLGGDFVLSRDEEGKTIKIGPYVGANLGFLLGQSGSTGATSTFTGASQRSLDASGGDPHLWLSLGVRGTLDP